jgi:hypothetical protein
MGAAPRSDVFDAISSLARASLGLSSAPPVLRMTAGPRVTEPWYCCAEPMEHI